MPTRSIVVAVIIVVCICSIAFGLGFGLTTSKGTNLDQANFNSTTPLSEVELANYLLYTTKIPPEHQETLLDPSHPRNKAINHILQITHGYLKLDATVLLMFHLLVFFYQSNGPYWTNTSGWYEYSPGLTPCNWHGIDCLSGNQTNIIGIRLPNNNVVGSLGNGLSAFDTLQILDFADNKLSGAFPHKWNRLEAVTYLDLSNNSFVGNIKGKGTIPLMTALTHLDLSSNAIQEQIWDELALLTDLQLLNLSSNDFYGTLPPNFGGENMEIYVHDNPQLIGPLPVDICNGVELLHLGCGIFEENCTCCVCHSE